MSDTADAPLLENHAPCRLKEAFRQRKDRPVLGQIGEATSGAGSAGLGREGARGCVVSAQWSAGASGAGCDLQGACLFWGSRGVPFAPSPIRGGTFLNGSCSMKIPLFTSGPRW